MFESNRPHLQLRKFMPAITCRMVADCRSSRGGLDGFDISKLSCPSVALNDDDQAWSRRHLCSSVQHVRQHVRNYVPREVPRDAPHAQHCIQVTPLCRAKCTCNSSFPPSAFI